MNQGQAIQAKSIEVWPSSSGAERSRKRFIGRQQVEGVSGGVEDGAQIRFAVMQCVFNLFQLGHALAQGTANALRLQAQTALCQVQIEENVRGSR